MAIRQMGGRYFRIRTGTPTGFNPFKLAPTRRNISFIKRLVRMLCGRNGKPLDPRDEERISAAVDTIMLDYPPEYRKFGITRLLEVLPEPPTPTPASTGYVFALNSGRRAASSAGYSTMRRTPSISATSKILVSTVRNFSMMTTFAAPLRFICFTASPACWTVAGW